MNAHYTVNTNIYVYICFIKVYVVILNIIQITFL